LKMYRISAPISGRLSVITAAAVLVCAAIAIPAARASSALLGATNSHRESHSLITIASGSGAVQTKTDEDDDKDVPPGQVDKYVSVYRSMQKDHGLTVEQAASKQGMTVTQFRSLEDKIERDDTLRERVRTALRKAANPNAKESDQEQ
jgi:predicted homoserine dehydrogenase-like protein